MTEKNEVNEFTRFVQNVGKGKIYTKRFGALTCRTLVPVMEGMRVKE